MEMLLYRLGRRGPAGVKCGEGRYSLPGQRGVGGVEDCDNPKGNKKEVGVDLVDLKLKLDQTSLLKTKKKFSSG